ncbi:MAG: helix-turn-helix transcriptional regulator [Campylobacterota bacterium]|nr:helix-turn-helix transcriptional regulator [Campylobacterota bacterium]
MLIKTIGKQIKTRRDELNLEIEDLSDYSDVTPSTISKIENGKSNPTIKTIEKLLIPLGLELTTILKDKEPLNAKSRSL